MLSSDNPEAGNVPAFLNKLWKLVEDPDTNNLIAWSKNTDEKSFIIKDQMRFTQELLPIYFKHCNFASFVRQLNMYGFRKVPSIEAGSLLIDKGEIEFAHPKFIRGQKGFLIDIKRKAQTPRILSPDKKVNDLSNVLSDIQALKVNQEVVGSQMHALAKENKQLWRENTTMRQRFQKQQQIIEKLVHFLMSMVNPNVPHLGPKRKFNQLALEGSEILGTSESSADKIPLQGTSSIEFGGQKIPKHVGPVIHEVSSDSLALEDIFEKAQTSESDSNFDVPSPESILGLPESESDLDVSLPDSILVKPSSKRREIITNKNNFNSNTKLISRLPILKGSRTIPLKLEPSLVYDYPEADTVIIEAEPEAVYAEATSNQENGTASKNPFITSHANIYSYSELPNTVSVESPNGTVLISNASLEEPPLSPEIMDTVDPSAVNPNIVVYHPNKPLIQTISSQTSMAPKAVRNSKLINTYVDSTKNSKVSKNSSKLDQEWKGTGKKASMGRPNSSIVASQSHPGKRKVNYGAGLESDDKTLDDYGPLNNSDLSSYPNNKVAIPEREEDIANYVDNVDNILDNFKMQINWGKFGNVDKSFLMSIFGNDSGASTLMQEADSDLPHAGNVIGSEVQLYNPPLYDELNEPCINDDIVDDFSFESLLNANEELSELSNKNTPKKLRVTSTKREKDEEDYLNTPRIEVNYDTPPLFRGKM